MPRNKKPGNDGLPAEFYLKFFDILGPILLKCINENFAFVKGRTIEELLRLLLHIPEFTDQENVGGILFAADYEAAFDSLDHCFIVSVFKTFNFPENFI